MFSLTDVALILVVVLLVFGPGKLPHLGEALGKSIRGFKKELEAAKPAREGAETLESGSKANRGQEVASRDAEPGK